MLSDLILRKEFKYEVYLCKPYYPYDKVSCLSQCIYDRSIKYQMQNINEFSFKIPYYWNDYNQSINENFDLVKAGMIVLVESYIDDTLENRDYFHIYEVELSGGDKEEKVVKAYSLQYKWNKIKIRKFSATTKIYDPVNAWNSATPLNSGIMNYILEVCLQNSWSISSVSSVLSSLYRTFDISEKSLIEVVREIESNFNCVFFFDTYNRSISIKHYDDLPSETGLIISEGNYLKNIKQQIKIDEIVTRLYPRGDNELQINSRNVTGQDYIDDFTFFKSTDYMSQGLLNALNAYESLLSTKQGIFSGYLSTLLAKQSELASLNIDLGSLNSELNICNYKCDIAQKTGQNVDGQPYSYWYAQAQIKRGQIASKQAEISAKQVQINAINNDINDLVDSVSYEANFTTQQLQELWQFINEESISSGIVDASELLLYGKQILAIKASPPIEFTLDMIDIFSCVDSNYAWDKLELGAKVDLMFEDFAISTKPRIVEYTHNPDANTLSVTVSNKTFFNDALNYVAAIFAQSKQTAVTVDMERDIYKDYYVNDKNSVLKNNSIIDTTTNTITMGDGSVISLRGLFMHDADTQAGQMKILGNRILFTNDNWLNYSLAITSTGIQTDGTFKLYSQNKFGTKNLVSIDGSKLQIYGGDTNSGIQIFNKNDALVFNLDANGNVVMNGGTLTITNGLPSTQLTDGSHLLKDNQDYNQVTLNSNEGLKILKKTIEGVVQATVTLNATTGLNIKNSSNADVFSVDTNGNLTISGSMTITGGTIVGTSASTVVANANNSVQLNNSYDSVYINGNGINGISAIKSDGNSRVVLNSTGLRIQQKNGVLWDDKFYADGSGNLFITGNITANSGAFSGNITSTATISGGTISGGTISGGTITIGDGNNVFKANGTNGIWLGSSIFSSAKFRVSLSGAVTASDINITGGNINISNDAVIGNNLRLGALSTESQKSIIYNDQANITSVTDGIGGYTALQISCSSLWLDGVSGLYGTWNFGNATVSGFQVKFA